MPPPKRFKDPTKQDIPEPQRPIRSVPLSKLVASPSPGLKEGPPTQELIKHESDSGTQRGKNRRNHLQDKWGNITGRVLDYLDGTDEKSGLPRLELLLDETKLKDIAIFAGIGTEKVLLLEGQPTQIIAQPQQAQLDKIGAALLDVAKQRGLIKLTERTATITLDGTPKQA